MPNIFLLQPGDQLLEMTESSYVSEDVLQQLLANHPDVLAGDQMPGDEPIRWLLIKREAEVPDEDSGVGRWALDHLFLDQYGVPTLVEVKRSSDTRLRREVVGQILDYAANAVAYWPSGYVRERFVDTCNRNGLDECDQLAEFLGIEDGDKDSGQTEAFWNAADTNLRAGRIRLVVVADVIPRELRRIIEFLNSQMDPAEFLAIEIKQFVGGNVKTLVPKVVGQSALARAKSSTPRAVSAWDRERFLAALEARADSETVRVAGEILTWIDQELPASTWGTGANDGSRIGAFTHSGRRCVALSIWSYGRIEIRFRRLQRDPPFDSLEKRQELARRLNQIGGVSISDDALSVLPAFDIALLSRKANLAEFYEVMKWLIAEIKRH